MGDDGNGSTRHRISDNKRSLNGVVSHDSGQSETLLALKRVLAERLIGTRAEFQEAVTCYSVRIQGILAQVGDVLAETTGSLTEDESRARERVLRRALDHLESLELKPAKGRRRDLKAVEILATDLATEFVDW